MELKNIFKMVKADRYTQDGREEIAKLQAEVTEDVSYKPGDISQKTGLQKQPDGSWAPPKGSSAAKHQKAMEGAKKTGIVNKVPAGWKKAEGVTTTPNGYVAITNGGSRFPKEGQAKREVKFIKQEDFEKGNATEGLESKSTEELTNLFNELATKSVREKSPENSAARDRVYKELKRRQKESSIKTQEKKNWDDFFSETDKKIAAAGNAEKLPEAKFDEYGLPDDETIAMKDLFLQKENVADPNKLTNAEFNALAKKLDSELGIGNMERAQELLVTPRDNPNYPFNPPTREARIERAKKEKERDNFLERMNAYREESKQWTNRAKGERTATLVDWLDDWDKHPEEKNDAAYTAIERELESRGVNRAGRQDAKKADNAGRNEFYRRAYEGDAAPKIRQLTGDCKIRIKK